jgi:hypothetical protein
MTPKFKPIKTYDAQIQAQLFLSPNFWFQNLPEFQKKNPNFLWLSPEAHLSPQKKNLSPKNKAQKFSG